MATGGELGHPLELAEEPAEKSIADARWPPAEGFRMIYLKFPNLGPIVYEPLRSWGIFTRFSEIGDDCFPTRHVDVFANGYARRYDRTHWIDSLGILADMRHHRKKWDKAGWRSLVIEPAEFEEQWRLAEASPALILQHDTALMSKWGEVPFWLRPRAEHA